MIDRRLAILLLSAIGLAGYALWSGDSAISVLLKPQDARPEKASPVVADASDPSTESSPTQLNPLAKLTAEQFADIVNRPLFNPSRAPKPPPPEIEPEPEPEVTEAPPVEEPPPNPEDFTLLGIAATDGTWSVVMRWNPTNEVFRLKTGGEIQGWTVAEIAPQQVTVNKDGQSLAIKMFHQKVSAPPIVEGEEEGSDPQRVKVEQGNGQEIE